MPVFNAMPPLYIPKKRKTEDIAGLEREKDQLDKEANYARKKLKARGSFDGDYWRTAVEIEQLYMRKTRIASDVSFSHFDGPSPDWQKTQEARHLFEHIRAQNYRISSFSAQKENLSHKKPKRSLREAFLKLFTTSPRGLGINQGAGAGNRDSGVQSNFRRELLEKYESLDETGSFAWCPILHEHLSLRNVTAAHIFSYKHGQGTMDAIFGKKAKPELFSARNGLILSNDIKAHFDSGVFAIVPDLPERPAMPMMLRWLEGEARDFKVRIIDPQWSMLDQGILTADGLKWRDLDNRKLIFKGKCRPAAQYLYFHYCLQILRRAWRAGPSQHAAFTLHDQMGKPIWATPGRYIPKSMLLAFVEELGHEYTDLLVAATRRRGRPALMMDTFSAQIAHDSEEDKSDSSSESDEDEEDV